MDWIARFVNLILHADQELRHLVQACGGWTYGVLFAIVFCETGLVVTPLLPGDSLLFAAGAIAAGGDLDVGWLFALLTLAAVAGDTVNYQVGHVLGPKVLADQRRFLKKEYLERTHRFFEKYGGKTIILARFAPIVRTFAPFLAGVGRMTYWRFLAYNVVGGVAWVAAFLFGGYHFGNLPVVRRNFSLVIAAIVVISFLPAVIEVVRARRRRAGGAEDTSEPRRNPDAG